MKRSLNLAVTRREFNTLLAALRYWAREGLRSDGFERLIANEKCVPLNRDETHALADRLNGMGEATRKL